MQNKENQEDITKHQETLSELAQKRTDKPISFIQGTQEHYRENDYAARIILKALSEGITDINELKKLAGLSKAAEVHRTLDKMGIRKDYHEALVLAGIDMPFLASKLKQLITDSKSEKIQLESINTVMKSVGLDKYEAVDDSGKGWEELIKNASGNVLEIEAEAIETADYEINEPEMPEEEMVRNDAEKKLSQDLYGK